MGDKGLEQKPLKTIQLHIQTTNKNTNQYLERQRGQPSAWRLPQGKFKMYKGNGNSAIGNGAPSRGATESHSGLGVHLSGERALKSRSSHLSS